MIELMRRDAQSAASAIVDNSNRRVIFFDSSLQETHRFFWNPSPADSFVHFGDGVDLDKGPVTPTTVEVFHVTYDQAAGLVILDTLRVRSSAGQRVTLATAFGLYNQ